MRFQRKGFGLIFSDTCLLSKAGLLRCWLSTYNSFRIGSLTHFALQSKELEAVPH